MEEKDNVKKTTRKRTSTKKNTEEKKISIEDIPQEVIAQILAMASVVNGEKTEGKKENKKRKGKATKADLNKIRDREIVLKSVDGMCGYRSTKTNVFYNWTDETDEEVMSVAEILNMESNSKKFLHTPWLVMAEDFEEGETIKMVVEALGLEKIYENLIDIDELLEKDLCDIEETINESTEGYKEIISSKIRKKVTDKELRDIILIKELERILNKSFM